MRHRSFRRSRTATTRRHPNLSVVEARRDGKAQAGGFSALIRQAEQTHGRRVVMLVDEYDKPILDNLTEPDIARAMRDGLRNLYSVIKDSDAHIRFAMLTGVSKFSKVSLFSGLNNLRDITLSAPYSAICGYTDADVHLPLVPEGKALQQLRDRAYADKYRARGEPIHLIGVEFSKDQRSVIGFEVGKA